MDLNNRTVGTIHIRMSHIHIHIYTHVWLWVKFPYFDGMNIYITNIISHFSPFPIESEQDKRSTDRARTPYTARPGRSGRGRDFDLGEAYGTQSQKKSG